jgi:hypothetical protein
MNVITGRSLEKDNEKSSFHLSEDELKKMIGSGRWEMESHGRDDHNYEKISPDGKTGHFMSNKLWLDGENRLETEDEFRKRIYADLLGSKQDLEKKLGVKILAYAYPFGDYGQATENFPESKGIVQDTVRSIFDISFSQVGGNDFPVDYGENSRLARRMILASPMNGAELLKTLDDNEDKPIPYEDNFSQNNGWLKGWGTMELSGNAMTITGSQFEDSGLAFLIVSYPWKNYYTLASARITGGNAFAVSARYKDENNYATCEFSDSHVVLGQRVDGKDLPDIEVLLKNDLSNGREINVGIDVYNDKATCYLDGKSVVSGIIGADLKRGGISFKVWNTLQKNAFLKITNLKVNVAPPNLIAK